MDRRLVKCVARGLWCAALAFCFFTSRQVPLLALVDLGFHKLGHLFTYPLPWELVTAAMGSIAQIAVPLGLAAYLWLKRGERLSAAACLAWTGTSAWGVHVYVADAPFERLQLIGGDHDWAFILHDLDRMSAAAPLSRAMWLVGLGCLAAAAGVCGWEPVRDAELPKGGDEVLRVSLTRTVSQRTKSSPARGAGRTVAAAQRGSENGEGPVPQDRPFVRWVDAPDEPAQPLP